MAAHSHALDWVQAAREVLIDSRAVVSLRCKNTTLQKK
jgi:hypothetical protein